MKYFIGIDGGGTKTASLLIDENGEKRASQIREGSSYKQYGMERVLATLKESVGSCAMEAGITAEQIAGCVIGLPCFGEDKAESAVIENKIKELFAPIPCHIVNDVEVGFAGSLGLKHGVHIVAGTGSIAFGKNKHGEAARSGGWSVFFGDEGSCYWLGRRTMELFSKQADDRVEKGPLYEMVMERFELEDAMDFIELMETSYISDRSKTASMQRILLEAARAGDQAAKTLYREAAGELGLMISGTVRQLKMEGEPFRVSYSGGLFHADELVLPYLRQSVEALGGALIKPQFEPVSGAALMAVDCFSDSDITVVKQNLE